MLIIAGLGNPGKEYENTRHNAGFMVMDALAEKIGADISEKKHVDTGMKKQLILCRKFKLNVCEG